MKRAESVKCDRTFGSLRCRKPFDHERNNPHQWHDWAVASQHVIGVYDGGELIASLSFDTWTARLLITTLSRWRPASCFSDGAAPKPYR